MINQFKEKTTYNEQTEKVSWTTLADTYTLPSQYQEVEYIENCKGCKHDTKVTGGRIVLDDFKMSDVPLKGTLNIDFNMSNINAPSNTSWFGCGRFTDNGAATHDMSVWSYRTTVDVNGDAIAEAKWPFHAWCAPAFIASGDGCYTSVIEYTPYYIYNFNIHYTYASSNSITWGGTIREYNTWVTPYYRMPDKTTSNNGKFNYDTHLCIFDTVMRDSTNPQYYGWPYSSRPTSTGHAIDSGSVGSGKRFYSRGKISINNNMYMYLYACYNKETHQYGLYDAVHQKFYGDFIETLDNVWGNQNYYWERINTASGSTVQAREKTFLNICGPDIKTT